MNMPIDNIEGYLSLDSFVLEETSDEGAYYFVRSVVHLADVLKTHYHDNIMAYAAGYAPREQAPTADDF